MTRRRESVQRRRRGMTEAEWKEAAERARQEARRRDESFLLGADANTFALIERFPIPAIRRQLALNVEAYREDAQRAERKHFRRVMAEALNLARRRPAPAFRIVLYADADPTRRVRAERELAKLGIPGRLRTAGRLCAATLALVRESDYN